MEMAHSALGPLIDHPKTTTLVTGVTYYLTCKLPLLISWIYTLFTSEGHIKPIVIEGFQIGGYATTMLVGVFTVIGYVRSWNKKEKEKDK